MTEGPDQLPTTRWSLVACAADEDREALEEILRLYIPALRRYLIARRRLSENDADDVLQSFLVEKVLEKPLLATARKERGRFRGLLLSALDRYCIDWWRRRKARADAGALPLEHAEYEADEESRETTETDWAAEIIRRAVHRVEDHCRRTNQLECWLVFEARLLRPALDGGKPEPYGSMVRRLGLISPREAANRLITAKRIFNRSLRQVVESYVRGRPGEIEEELLELKQILERSGRPGHREGTRECQETSS